MRIKHLRQWLEILPSEYDENEIVFRDFKEVKDSDDVCYALDIPIAACGIDKGNGEMFLCDEKSSKII